MKNFSASIITLILVLTPLLQSCLDDNNDEYLAVATYRLTESNDPYFVLDDSEKMHPQNGSFSNLKDGQRAYVYFEQLEEKVSGYKYNIQVRGVQPILTKNVIAMTEETADSIGDNRINITRRWFGDGYLNLQFQFYGTRNPSELHMVNLVRNEIEGAETEAEEGYINLEFRHNAYDDSPAEKLNGIVAFKGPFTAEENMKGLKIRYNSTYDGVKYIKIDFPKEQTGSSDTSFNPTFSPTMISTTE